VVEEREEERKAWVYEILQLMLGMTWIGNSKNRVLLWSACGFEQIVGTHKALVL
jgi:hypothetical protein